MSLLTNWRRRRLARTHDDEEPTSDEKLLLAICERTHEGQIVWECDTSSLYTAKFRATFGDVVVTLSTYYRSPLRTVWIGGQTIDANKKIKERLWAEAYASQGRARRHELEPKIQTIWQYVNGTLKEDIDVHNRESEPAADGS